MRTGLWEATAYILKKRLADLLKPGVLDKGFYLVPVSAPYRGSSLKLEEVDSVTTAINAKSNVYIPSLGVQLIKTSDKGAIDRALGAEGLRKSPAECAAICADYIADKIRSGNEGDAIALIQYVMGLNADPSVKDSKNREVLDSLVSRPNTLIASCGVDPVRQSSVEAVEALSSRYASLEPEHGDPFHITHNLQVMKGLIGKDITALFDVATPSFVSAELLDVLTTVADLVTKTRAGRSARYPSQNDASNLRVEKFYQAMQRVHHLCRFQFDWKGLSGPSLEEALVSLLPRLTSKPRQVLFAPHGLSVLRALRDALGEDADSVGILKGAYYETPDLFPSATVVDSVDAPELRKKKVIVLEPHPNNAAELEIHPHNVCALLESLFTTNKEASHSVIVDLTLSHLSEPDVGAILQCAGGYILSGNLNLVFVQSGTKFYQSGMDLVNVGTALVFNDGSSWEKFNQALAGFKNSLPPEDRLYIARMLGANGPLLLEYLEEIRRNTARMRKLLGQKLSAGSNALTLCHSTDKETVYLAFRPKDEFVARMRSKEVGELTTGDRAKVNQAIYLQCVIPALREAELPAVDRTSFGFNVTNLGECYTTVRITPGIEEDMLFKCYSAVIASVGVILQNERFVLRV
ncbi:hypothetical protein Q664_18680 [Archangium violaceum Cb vi76]|uniref:Uncharacterized protein n=2 Tax=Archangium violaceum TaxID=83451 RepID=A0A084SU25_9BACT|nr:hypothetical protein Q664_18680 [Archangium violaceum Cb vi76]